jgi:serine/threonine protein kinase
MSLNEDTKLLLENLIFKGKIVARHEGRGGVVYIVQGQNDLNKVAYKTTKKIESDIGDGVNVADFEREAKNWFSFSGHTLVIRPYFVKYWNKHPLICMPYCDGDLSDLVGQGQSLTSAVCLSLQLVKAMMTANMRGMDHHQDIKPENLLFIDLSKKFHGFPSQNVDQSVKYSVRVADFGVANGWHDKYQGGTNIYKAPEQHDSSCYEAFAPDLFAVGLVIAELFQGYHPAENNPGEVEKIRKKGSKQKKWAFEGERHLALGEPPQAQELVLLIREMLSVNPSNRPSFKEVYGRLSNILKILSPTTLDQLELLFEYYDKLASTNELEGSLERLLKRAEIPSQQCVVQEDIRKQLKKTLREDTVTLENIFRTHHLARAFQKVCSNDLVNYDKNILIEASKRVVEFVLTSVESITSNELYPPLSFEGIKPTKFGSDLEAKVEILSTSIKRLERLNAYDDQLSIRVEEGGDLIKACMLMSEACDNWYIGRRPEACKLLKEVRLLVPFESELEKLYKIWVTGRDCMKDFE